MSTIFQCQLLVNCQLLSEFLFGGGAEAILSKPLQSSNQILSEREYNRKKVKSNNVKISKLPLNE